MTQETRKVTVTVELPSDIDWQTLAQIEDEISESAGDVLKSHGLERNSHERRVSADYSERR